MLIVYDDLLAAKMFRQMAQDDVFLNFATNACEAHRSIILRIGFITFFVDTCYFGFGPVRWNSPNIVRLLEQASEHWCNLIGIVMQHPGWYFIRAAGLV